MIFIGPTLAQVAAAKTVTLCVELDVNFLDAGGDLAIGDWFDDNDEDQRFYGGKVIVTDDVHSTAFNLDSDGCSTFSVTVSVGQTYPVTVYTEASVSGVTVKGHHGYDWSAGEDSVTEYVNWFATTTKTILIDESVLWRQMAIGVWVMHRNTFHLGTATANRDCCYAGSPGLTSGGECTNSAYFYQADDNPESSPTTLDYFDEPPPTGGCSTSTVDDERAVCQDTNKPFPIAHETGHVVVEKRFGVRTETDSAVNYLNCDGGYTIAEIVLPLDPTEGHPGGRSDFSAEFQSEAAREGWAIFFSTWAFNRRTETDCQYQAQVSLHDFDLDEDLDDNFGDTGVNFGDEAEGDGAYDCAGNLVLAEPYGADTVESYAFGDDWLEHMVAATASTECGATSLANRGTVYDWSRFWRDMTASDQGNVAPEVLADVYVDMCPENWRTNASGSQTTPVGRLTDAAAANSVTSAYNNEKTNGQDH